MKNFVYFFKHKGIDAIKIGRTSGESVNTRFNQFKTYSPFGSEILGFFECKDAVQIEREIHERLKSHRMTGEWFDISVGMCISIINEYDTTENKAKLLFNEWISDENNDVNQLILLLKKANQTPVTKKDFTDSLEYNLINKFLLPKDDDDAIKMSATKIKEYLEVKSNQKLSLNNIGICLNKLNFKQKHMRVNSVTQRLYSLQFLNPEDTITNVESQV
ncbi:MAG: GIY-YIG nuclease family protein [Chitinophagaceae bacterium]